VETPNWMNVPHVLPQGCAHSSFIPWVTFARLTRLISRLRSFSNGTPIGSLSQNQNQEGLNFHPPPFFSVISPHPYRIPVLNCMKLTSPAVLSINPLVFPFFSFWMCSMTDVSQNFLLGPPLDGLPLIGSLSSFPPPRLSC